MEDDAGNWDGGGPCSIVKVFTKDRVVRHDVITPPRDHRDRIVRSIYIYITRPPLEHQHAQYYPVKVRLELKESTTNNRIAKRQSRISMQERSAGS